jgi:hypothetical protein
MKKLNELKFAKGDITDVFDFEKSLGDLMYVFHDAVYKFDEESEKMTDEIEGYEMTVMSEVTDKQYKIKFDDPMLDFSTLTKGEIVKLKNPVTKIYNDSTGSTQGTTISVSAKGLLDQVASKQDTVQTPISTNPQGQGVASTEVKGKDKKQG